VGKYAEGYSGYVDVVKDAVSAAIKRVTKTKVGQGYLLNDRVSAGSAALWCITYYKCHDRLKRVFIF
jgi:hypothetical protein